MLGLLLPAGAAAADPRGDASAATVATFADICIAHEGDVRGARAALAARHLRPLPRWQARRLMVHPGRIFDVPLAGGEHLAVVSLNNGMCGTVAADVDGGALLAALADTTKRRGIAVEAIGRAPNGVGQAYRLRGPTTRLELMVDIEPLAGGHVQASMLAMALDGENR